MTRALQGWSALNDIWNLQDELNNFFGRGKTPAKTGDENAMWYPSVDICEDKESVKLRVDLAGLEKGDVKINVEEGVLTIRGERSMAKEDKKENYHRIERSYGTFSRSFTLPSSADEQKIAANMKNGLLEVLIPKKEEAKPREIEVKIS